jgi:hypothetical protein
MPSELGWGSVLHSGELEGDFWSMLLPFDGVYCVLVYKHGIRRWL